MSFHSSLELVLCALEFRDVQELGQGCGQSWRELGKYPSLPISLPSWHPFLEVVHGPGELAGVSAF